MPRDYFAIARSAGKKILGPDQVADKKMLLLFAEAATGGDIAAQEGLELCSEQLQEHAEVDN